jgi:hypothetical protein
MFKITGKKYRHPLLEAGGFTLSINAWVNAHDFEDTRLNTGINFAKRKGRQNQIGGMP